MVVITTKPSKKNGNNMWQNFFRVKLHALLGIIMIFLMYHFQFEGNSPAPSQALGSNDKSMYATPSSMSQSTSASSAPPKNFDCAVFWLRMPKTGSTSATRTLISPLSTAGGFVSTETGPNTCIAGVGGCAQFWSQKNTTKSKNSSRTFYTVQPRYFEQVNIIPIVGPAIPAPPYGQKFLDIPHGIHRTQQSLLNLDFSNDSKSDNNEPQRCFPSVDRELKCYEYDARTSTMNFGPHRTNPHLPKIRQQLRENPSLADRPLPAPPTNQTANYDYSPTLTTHVGLDPSLFGWIMPSHPMVFSTFRDPIDRLLSSFHYGIQFGGGRPGAVDKCRLPGSETLEEWQERVANARKIVTTSNDTSVYQNLLREYLNECRCASDNAYVQFLDPNTKDVNVALDNLEKYVIVGLQQDIEGSLERWLNITLRSCQGRKQILWMKKRLTEHLVENGAKVWRESVALTDSELNLDGSKKNKKKNISEVAESVVESSLNNNTEVAKSVEESSLKLASPKFESFDKDLQELITEYTAGDAIVYERALRAYEEQRHWGL